MPDPRAGPQLLRIENVQQLRRHVRHATILPTHKIFTARGNLKILMNLLEYILLAIDFTPIIVKLQDNWKSNQIKASKVNSPRNTFDSKS